MVEYTLTIYLFGFALGTLFWGKLSDRFGRKPCILAGFIIFIIGCIGCYLADSITLLLTSRLIQAFGGSIGSVLAQALCRDAFHGPELGRVYSSIGSALAVYPAIGPVIGGYIAQQFGWPNVFLFLLFFAILLTVLVALRLPETHPVEKRTPVSLKKVMVSLLHEKKVIGLGLIVGACNGISFSYFAEGAFNLITLLDLTPAQYGLSFIPIACSTVAGGLLSRKLQAIHDSKKIMRYGLLITLVGSSFFTIIILLSQIIPMSNALLIATTLVAQMIIAFGTCIANSNALPIALTDYKWCVGTASSLFGFFYYCIVSVVTMGMAILHNGTLLPMPFYFLGISLFMLLVSKTVLRD